MNLQIPRDSGPSFMYEWLVKHNYGKIIDVENLDSRYPVVIFPKSLKNKFLYNFICTFKNYIMIENGYWGNYDFKKKKWYRISWKSVQNYKINSFPHSRKHLLTWPSRDWEIPTEKSTLIIVPSILTNLLDNTRDNWISETKDKFVNSSTTWRYKPLKKGKNRLNDIIADFKIHSDIYTHTSVAAVEAALYDIPVTCSFFCAAYPVSQIENPISKDLWLEHLSWSQFHVDEFRDGTAWELTFQYQIKDNE